MAWIYAGHAIGSTLIVKRGIRCEPPRPYITKADDGRDITNFNNSVVLDVSGPRNCVFFCEWGVDGTIFPWKEKLTEQARRAREQVQLKESAGGVLGITGLLETQVTTPALAQTAEKWLAITGPDTVPIFLGVGVELSLVEENEQQITSIVIGVTSVEKTRSTLNEMGLLGESNGKECSLIKDCSGLHFRFREPRTV